MKRRMAIGMLLLSVIVLCGCFFAPISSVSAEKVTPVSSNDSVLAARFLNMLNHNASYNEDFESVEALVNNATAQLCDLRDAADEDYIAAGIVADYMMNFYGIELSDFSLLNSEFPQKENFIFILPRGRSLYSHKFVSATENEDGSFSVVTEVTVTPHDSESYSCKASSLFVRSTASDFGFHLIYSNLFEDSATV